MLHYHPVRVKTVANPSEKIPSLPLSLYGYHNLLSSRIEDRVSVVIKQEKTSPSDSFGRSLRMSVRLPLHPSHGSSMSIIHASHSHMSVHLRLSSLLL